MKKSTLGLFVAGLALALAGGANQALAIQACSPVGGCDGGDRCNKNGLWIGDKSCDTKIHGASPILPADKIALGAGTAFAQTERGAPRVGTAEFGTRLQASDRQLASIEQLFTQIEAAKLPAEKEKLFDELSQPLAAYAKGMMESFDTAMKQAELAAKSQGKQGSTRLVKPFEALAVKHEQRMKQLDERGEKIEIAGRPFKQYCKRTYGPPPFYWTTGFKCNERSPK